MSSATELVELAGKRNNSYVAPSDSETTLHEVNNAAQELYETCAHRWPERYWKTKVIPVLADTTEYSLPADFWKLIGTGCGLFIFNTTSGAIVETYHLTAQGSAEVGFWLDDARKKLVITPKPTAAFTHPLTLRYVPVLEMLTSVEAQVFTPDGTKRYDRYYEWALAIQAAEREEEDQSVIDVYEERRNSVVQRILAELGGRERNVLAL